MLLLVRQLFFFLPHESNYILIHSQYKTSEEELFSLFVDLSWSRAKLSLAHVSTTIKAVEPQCPFIFTKSTITLFNVQ